MPYKNGFLGTNRQLIIFTGCLKRFREKYSIEFSGTDLEKDFEETFGAKITLVYGEEAYNDMEEKAKKIADNFTGGAVDIQIEKLVEEIHEKYFNN